MRRRNSWRRRAFSLVELMVAMVLLSLVCVMLFSILGSATKLWQDQGAKEEGFREARAALNFLSRDVANAIATTNQNWFYAGTNKIAFLTALPATAQSKTGNRSDICEVGYSLEWGRENPSDLSEKEHFALYRYVRFSDPTHGDLTSLSKPIQDIFDSPDNVTTVRELMARNVSRISCDLYSTNAAGEVEAYTPAHGFPDIFSFTVSTLNGRTAARLPDRNAWSATNSLLISQNEQTFCLRVHSSQVPPTSVTP